MFTLSPSIRCSVPLKCFYCVWWAIKFHTLKAFSSSMSGRTASIKEQQHTFMALTAIGCCAQMAPVHDSELVCVCDGVSVSAVNGSESITFLASVQATLCVIFFIAAIRVLDLPLLPFFLQYNGEDMRLDTCVAPVCGEYHATCLLVMLCFDWQCPNIYFIFGIFLVTFLL